MRGRAGGRWWALAFIALLLGACSRQAVVGSPGTPGAGTTETTLRSDLAILHDAELRYREVNGRYTDRLEELEFTPSPGVDVSFVQGDRQGYSALATAGDRECAVFGGEARPPRGYVTRAGVVGCRP